MSVVWLIILASVAQFGGFSSTDPAVLAANEEPINRNGTVNVNTVANVRDQPTTSGSKTLFQLARGDVVLVLSSVKGGSTDYGDLWYKIEFTDDAKKVQTGYIVAAFVVVDLPDPEPDQAFEDYLDAQGFPESYRVGLRRLHARFPKWVFVAQQTGLEWQYVLDQQEANPYTNVIPKSYPDGYKSTKQYSKTQLRDNQPVYNWTTNQWGLYDAGWNMCNQAVLAYYMDPRNFLDQENIFQFELLAFQPDAHNRDGVEKILAGSFMGNKEFTYIDAASNKSTKMTYAAAFMKAAEYSGVSPYHLASRSLIEVGSNGSPSVSGTFSQDLVKYYKNNRGTNYTPTASDLACDGIFNFYNIGAYSSNAPLGNVKNGLDYARQSTRLFKLVEFNPGYKAGDKEIAIPWNNPLRSIVGGAMFIGSSYINRNPAQNTLYLQKFDLHEFWHQYMGNVLAPSVEGVKMYNAYNKMDMLQMPLVFSIPVYQKMPEAASPLPDRRNPNNWLKTLTVSGYQVTPSFDPATTKGYGLIVSEGVDTITIDATAVVSQAAISGTGKKKLDIGDNLFKIVVTAENGQKRTYELTVTRRGTLPPLDEIEGQELEIKDHLILGLDPVNKKNTIEFVKNDLILPQDCTVQFVDSKGQPLSGPIGTDCSLLIRRNDELVAEHKFLLYGDANGDGAIDAMDLMIINRQMLKKLTLDPLKNTAADVNQDGALDAMDLMIINRQMLKKLVIVQVFKGD